MHQLNRAESDVWRTFLLAHTRVADRIERALRSTGLSLVDYEVLSALAQAPENRLRMSDLAYRVAASRSGLTRQIDRLVRRGFVERASCPKDRRGLYAVLSKAGGATLESARPSYEAAVLEFFCGSVRDDELDAVGSALERVLKASAPRGECAAVMKDQKRAPGSD